MTPHDSDLIQLVLRSRHATGRNILVDHSYAFQMGSREA